MDYLEKNEKNKKEKSVNLDVLAKYLDYIDRLDYDSPITCNVLRELGKLNQRTQNMIIKVALGVNMTYLDILNHVRKQFIILKQTDDIGKYCGLGFGEDCISVATWSEWDLPKHAEDVDITKVCYKGKDDKLRCGHLLDFAELWMDMNNSTFENFLNGITIETP